MEQVIIAIHVIAAILLIGPVAISTSMYAPALRRAQSGSREAAGSLQTIATISRRYGLISLIIPVLGLIAFFVVDGATKNYAFHAAILLSIATWLVLIVAVLPKHRQGLISVDALTEADTPATGKEKEVLQNTDASSIPGKAAMFAGIFNLLWIITAILMFV